ncbi:MAG: HAD family phosphatase [Erysipelotrichaceae bacterium]|nr:HAD family phosphatase [Erysipelotrichaceae bacterium]
MDYKIIFSDIDGTLINDQHLVTPKTKDAIRQLNYNHCLFVPVSARMPEAIETVTKQIGSGFPMICYNGALVLDASQNVIASFPMDQNVAMDVCRYVEKHLSRLAWNAYGHHQWLSQSHDRKFVEREESIVEVQSTPAIVDDIKDMEAVHKLLLMGAEEDIAQAADILTKQYPQLSIVRSSKILLEIMNQGIRKGKAVELLSHHYSIPLSETLSFGDNYNDLDMLTTTGTAYVMGNAPEDIKQTIKNVTLDNNHDGIAQVLITLKHID